MMRPLIMLLPAAALLLAGCGDKQIADPIGPTTATTTHAPSPGIPEPTLPARAKPADVQGAANFLEFYLKLLDYAKHTGDTTALRRYSSPTCDGCYGFIDLYEKIYRDGGFIRGGERTFPSMEPVADKNEPGAWYIYLTVSNRRGTYRYTDKEPVSVSTPEALEVGAHIVRTRNSWFVTSYGMVAKK